jgi:hypothetical protein
MAKRIVKLTEGELKHIIKESVNRVLNEMDDTNEGLVWDAIKSQHRENKKMKPEYVKRDLKDIITNKDGETLKYIKGEDTPQRVREYNHHKFNRQNGLQPGIRGHEMTQDDANFAELERMPGLRGKLSRGAVVAGVAADAAYRHLRNKMQGKI